MSLVAELRRRNVFRVAAAYLVVGWLLTEVLTTILPTLGAPEWASRAVILIFAFGFIPAVVLSWFYEITPEGIKRDDEIVRESPDGGKTRRRFDHIAIVSAVVLIILVGLFSARHTSDEPVPLLTEISDASVAVLPFVNMSTDEDNEYFSDGLTETLLHMLAQVPELKVAARTSSFAFKGKSLSIQEIARALEVAHILEGSVQRVGDRVRITAQLIRASDGFHVWSENFDRQLDDIFAVQDEIARKVGYALSESLLGNGLHDDIDLGVATTSTDAYDLFLQACKERSTFSYGGLRAAEDLLKGALLIDPDFVEAKTELATSYIHQLETGLMSDDEAYSRIIAITDQVLADDPDNFVARAASVFARTGEQRSRGDAAARNELVRELESIVIEAPDEIQAKVLLVRAYQGVQQNDKALPVLRGALKADPFNPALHYELGTAYMRLEQWDEAREALQKSLDIEAAQPNAYTNLSFLALRDGDGVEFITQFMNAISVDPKDHELPGLLAAFLYQLELVDIADDFRQRVQALAPTSEIAYRLELLRAVAVGDNAASLASARRAISDDIDDRRFGHTGAVQYLLRTAIRNRSVDQEMAWIGERAPGIFDIDADGLPQKYRMAQGIAFDAWFVTLPREETLARLDALLDFGKTLGFDLADDAYTHLNILALRGDIEQAVEVGLERVFRLPVTTNLAWRETFAQAQYADIVADPRVRAELERWAQEEAELRSNVAAYFTDLQTVTQTARASRQYGLDRVGKRAVLR